MFLQAARMEAAAALNTSGVSPLVATSVQLDGRKYYEQFNHDKLFERYLEAGGEATVAKLLGNFWKAAVPVVVREVSRSW